MNDSVFQKKLLSVMKDNLYDRVIPKRKAGKLDFNNLWRVHVGAKNVFQSKQERKNKEYNLVICLDESGSMARKEKLYKAKEILKFLTGALDRAGVNFAVIGYNCNVTVHKKFDERVTPDDMMDRVDENYNSKTIHHVTKKLTTCNASCGNHDFLALKTSMDLLKERKHGKILLMLSDGNPSCDYPQDCGYLQELHKTSRLKELVLKNQDVISVGVSVLHAVHLDQIFNDVVEVNDTEEFKDKIVDILNRKIKRG